MSKSKYNPGDIVGNNFLLIEKIKPIYNGKGYLCKFKCPLCGKIFESDLYNITKKKSKYVSCGCYKKEYVQFQPDKEIIGKRFGQLIVLEDDGTRVNCPNSPDKGSIKWKCLCDCGKIAYVTSTHLKSGHTTSCGHCCISKGENKIKTVLKENGILFETQKRFNDCRDINPLPFDFYLSDYNCCIEYDGEQHFHIPSNNKSTYFTEDKINKIQFHDKIKTEYCKNKNIKLIRVPYTDYDILTIEYLFKNFGSTGD